MRRLRDEVMAQPADKRLDHALFLIDELTGDLHRSARLFQVAFKLSPTDASVLCILNDRAPNPVSREAIYAALYGACEERTPKIISVWVNRLRKRLGSGVIETVWGGGWRMPVRMDAPRLVASAPLDDRHPQAGARWTKADDAELLRMIGTRSHLSCIAEELDRSEGAIAYRIGVLRRRQAVAA